MWLQVFRLVRDRRGYRCGRVFRNRTLLGRFTVCSNAATLLCGSTIQVGMDCAVPSVGRVVRGCGVPSTLGDRDAFDALVTLRSGVVSASFYECICISSVCFSNVANVSNALRTGSPTDSDGVVDDGVFEYLNYIVCYLT